MIHTITSLCTILQLFFPCFEVKLAVFFHSWHISWYHSAAVLCWFFKYICWHQLSYCSFAQMLQKGLYLWSKAPHMLKVIDISFTELLCSHSATGNKYILLWQKKRNVIRFFSAKLEIIKMLWDKLLHLFYIFFHWFEKLNVLKLASETVLECKEDIDYFFWFLHLVCPIIICWICQKLTKYFGFAIFAEKWFSFGKWKN